MFETKQWLCSFMPVKLKISPKKQTRQRFENVPSIDLERCLLSSAARVCSIRGRD
jgi:hypothetical protein